MLLEQCVERWGGEKDVLGLSGCGCLEHHAMGSREGEKESAAAEEEGLCYARLSLNG